MARKVNLGNISDILREAGPVTHRAIENLRRAVGQIPSTASTTSTVTSVTQSTAASGVTDHGALTGLADNDHPQYLLTADASGIYAASGVYLTPSSGDADYLRLDGTNDPVVSTNTSLSIHNSGVGGGVHTVLALANVPLTPQVSDGAQLTFQTHNSVATLKDAASIQGKLTILTDGNEFGTMNFFNCRAGTLEQFMVASAGTRRIGIYDSGPSYTLDVNGDVNSQTALRYQGEDTDERYAASGTYADVSHAHDGAYEVSGTVEAHKADSSDVHTQYLLETDAVSQYAASGNYVTSGTSYTKTESDARYDATGTAAAAVTTHEAASDPHVGYILADGSRAFTNAVVGVAPSSSSHLATKAYVDSATGVTATWDRSELGGFDTPTLSGSYFTPDGYSDGAKTDLETSYEGITDVIAFTNPENCLDTSGVLNGADFATSGYANYSIAKNPLPDGTTTEDNRGLIIVSGLGTGTIASGELTVQFGNETIYGSQGLTSVYYSVDAGASYTLLDSQQGTAIAQASVGLGSVDLSGVYVKVIGKASAGLGQYRYGTATFYGAHVREVVDVHTDGDYTVHPLALGDRVGIGISGAETTLHVSGQFTLDGQVVGSLKVSGEYSWANLMEAPQYIQMYDTGFNYGGANLPSVLQLKQAHNTSGLYTGVQEYTSFVVNIDTSDTPTYQDASDAFDIRVGTGNALTNRDTETIFRVKADGSAFRLGGQGGTYVHTGSDAGSWEFQSPLVIASGTYLHVDGALLTNLVSVATTPYTVVPLFGHKFLLGSGAATVKLPTISSAPTQELKFLNLTGADVSIEVSPGSSDQFWDTTVSGTLGASEHLILTNDGVDTWYPI